MLGNRRSADLKTGDEIGNGMGLYLCRAHQIVEMTDHGQDRRPRVQQQINVARVDRHVCGPECAADMVPRARGRVD